MWMSSPIQMDIDFSQYFAQARKTFREDFSLPRIRRAGIKTARVMAEEFVYEAKNIIDEDTDSSEVSSGGLAASLGIWDPTYLRGRPTDAGPGDAVWIENFVRREYEITYGSNLRYAGFYLYGFTMDETRVVYINGRFVTVRPFVWGGTYALERAHMNVVSDPQRLQSIFNREMRNLGFR